MTSTPYTRALTPSDYASFRALRQAHLDADAQSVATSSKDWREAPAEKVMALLQFEGLREHDFIMGVFEEDEALVGMLGFQRNVRKMQTAHKGTFWGLYVDRSARGRGLGKRLVEDALATIATYDWCEMIRVQITTTDTAAIHLAEVFGFEQMGTERKAKKIDGAYFDDFTYIKYLTP